MIEEIEKLKKQSVQNIQSNLLSRVPQTQPGVCPSCGVCPTCGKSNGQQNIPGGPSRQYSPSYTSPMLTGNGTCGGMTNGIGGAGG